MAKATKQNIKNCSFDELAFVDELSRLMTSATAIISCVEDAARHRDEPVLADAIIPAGNMLTDAYSLIQRWNDKSRAVRALEAQRNADQEAKITRNAPLDAGTIKHLEGLIKASKQHNRAKKAA